MAWETYTDNEGYEYYYNPDTGISTYEVPEGMAGQSSEDIAMSANPMQVSGVASVDKGSQEDISMSANPMMFNKKGGGSGGSAADKQREVQLGDLVDVDRTGKGKKRGYERAKIIAVHIAGYEAFRDDDGYAYYYNEATGDNTYDKPRGEETVDAQFRKDGAIMTGIALSRIRNSAKGRRRAGWCRRNWVMVLLFGVGLFGILFALLCFLEPCAPGVITKKVQVPYTVVANKTVQQLIDVHQNVTRNVTRTRDVVTNVVKVRSSPAAPPFIFDVQVRVCSKAHMAY